MTQPDPVHEQDRWSRQAERDLDDARYAFEGSRFNLACFLCQQSAEKAIKAFLYGAGRRDIREHSVARLCDEAAEIEPGFVALRERAAPLDQLYVPTRYPNGLAPGAVPFESYGAEDAKLALDRALAVIEFVKGRLRSPPPPAGSSPPK